MKIKFFVICFLLIGSVLQSEAEYVYIITNLQMRENPSLNSKIVTLIKAWSEIEVIDKNGSNDTINGIKGRWIKVNYDGKTGWCFNGYTSPVLSYPQSYNPADFLNEAKYRGLIHVSYPDGINFLGRTDPFNVKYEITFIQLKLNNKRYILLEKEIGRVKNNKGSIKQILDYKEMPDDTGSSILITPFYGSCKFNKKGLPIIAVSTKDVTGKECYYSRIVRAWSTNDACENIVPTSNENIRCSPPCCGKGCD